MDIPAFSGDRMSGSGRRRTAKWDFEERSGRFPGEPLSIGTGLVRLSYRESQPRWHSGEGNYREARETLVSAMVWDGESSMSPGLDDWRQQKRKHPYDSYQGRSYRHRSPSQSKSPGHRFEQSDLIDRRGQLASFDHRYHEPTRSGTIPCKFFASGNCRNGKFCRFSHNDSTHDSFDKYKPADHRQSMASRVDVAPSRERSKWSGAATDSNVPTHNGDKSERHGEQRVMRSSVIDSAATKIVVPSRESSKWSGTATDINVPMNNGDKYEGHGKQRVLRSSVDDSTATENVVPLRESSKWIKTATDISVPMNYGDKNERHGEQRVMRSSVDDSAATENVVPLRESSKWNGTATDISVPTDDGDKFERHGEERVMNGSVDNNAATENIVIDCRMDSDEATRNNRNCDSRLTPHSSSRMGASDPRGSTILGVDLEGSITHIGNQLPTQIEAFRKPDILDTVRSKATTSNQCLLSTQQFSDLTVSLAKLLEDGKQLPELYAALYASNALGFMQSAAAAPDVTASSSSQYDPVTDSMELIKAVISEHAASEQLDEIALPSQSPITGEPSGDGVYRTDCKDVELNVTGYQSNEKHQTEDCKNEENGTMKAEEMTEGLVNSKLDKKEGDVKTDEKKNNNDGKSLRAFKFALAELVKELLKPMWKEGKINKDDHKSIVKKVIDKVTSTVQGVHIPQSQEKLDNYMSASKPKLSKLVQAYAEKVLKEKPKAA